MLKVKGRDLILYVKGELDDERVKLVEDYLNSLDIDLSSAYLNAALSLKELDTDEAESIINRILSVNSNYNVSGGGFQAYAKLRNKQEHNLNTFHNLIHMYVELELHKDVLHLILMLAARDREAFERAGAIIIERDQD